MPNRSMKRPPHAAATPRAVEILLDAGRAPNSLAYYRGGLHDWVTLGLPTVAYRKR